jgi:hypothetical protein
VPEPPPPPPAAATSSTIETSDTSAVSGAAQLSSPAPAEPANEPALSPSAEGSGISPRVDSPTPRSKPISDTERRVYDAMEADPPHHGERGYARKIRDRLGLGDTDLHTVENYVSKYRRELEKPKKSSKSP